MAQKRRPIELKFHVTEGEREIIARKMELAGTRCTAAYLRKMALDGYTLKIELPELQELVSLLRRSSGNLNQIAKRVNSTSRIYDTDMEELLQSQERLWAAANDLLARLTPLK